jgi:hypothetical protein
VVSKVIPAKCLVIYCMTSLLDFVTKLTCWSDWWKDKKTNNFTRNKRYKKVRGTRAESMSFLGPQISTGFLADHGITWLEWGSCLGIFNTLVSSSLPTTMLKTLDVWYLFGQKIQYSATTVCSPDLTSPNQQSYILD